MGADERIALWREFLALTERQGALIQSGDADALAAAVAERAAVIDALDALGGADYSSAEIDALRSDAAARNAVNAELLRRAVAEAKDELRKSKLTRRGVTGYGMNAEYGAYDSFDIKL